MSKNINNDNKEELNNKDDEIIDNEINEEDINEEDIEIIDDDENTHKDTDFDIMFKGTANKHKLEGTHALKRDTILMGKLDEENLEDEMSSFSDYDAENYDLEKGSVYEYETRDFEDYYYKQQLKKDVHKILEEKTEIKFTENRRKPDKEKFNNYYKMCLDDLNTKYTKSEIFVNLSYYFTDNIFNMYKLLNKKNASGIIYELKEKGYLKDISNINFI